MAIRNLEITPPNEPLSQNQCVKNRRIPTQQQYHRFDGPFDSGTVRWRSVNSAPVLVVAGSSRHHLSFRNDSLCVSCISAPRDRYLRLRANIGPKPATNQPKPAPSRPKPAKIRPTTSQSRPTTCQKPKSSTLGGYIGHMGGYSFVSSSCEFSTQSSTGCIRACSCPLVNRCLAGPTQRFVGNSVF